jgi:hypothetical protein
MANKRKGEPTQPGNPHRLARVQHIHSAACIARFADADGTVSVLHKAAPAPFRKAPEDKTFAADRVWDHGLERVFLKYEDAFQEECDRILKTGMVQDHESVTNYFVLWTVRAETAKAPPDGLSLVGVSGSGVTRDQEEILESKGAAYARDGGVVPARFVASLSMRRDLMLYQQHLDGQRWGVLLSTGDIGLVCPDNPANTLCIPINRFTLLAAGFDDGGLKDEDVTKLNRDFWAEAHAYVFGHARDIRRVLV